MASALGFSGFTLFRYWVGTDSNDLAKWVTHESSTHWRRSPASTEEPVENMVMTSTHTKTGTILALSFPTEPPSAMARLAHSPAIVTHQNRTLTKSAFLTSNIRKPLHHSSLHRRCRTTVSCAARKRCTHADGSWTRTEQDRPPTSCCFRLSDGRNWKSIPGEVLVTFLEGERPFKISHSFLGGRSTRRASWTLRGLRWNPENGGESCTGQEALRSGRRLGLQ